MSQVFNEQRRYPRVKVNCFADWGWGPECEYYDKVTSLSLGGCFLATKRELRAGDEIFIKLSGEIAGTIDLQGAIRYQLRVVEEAPPSGAGVAFVGVSSGHERKLQAVVENYRIRSATDSRGWMLIQ
jgi:Tfp pilus assembly protein PilZ